MTLIQKIATKLGAYTIRKGGEEFTYTCPRCHHVKLEINPKKKLFHCFRCGYKGTLGQILKDLNIVPFSTIAVNSVEKPVVVEAQECKIPLFVHLKKLPYTVHAYLTGRKYLNPYDVVGRWGLSAHFSMMNRLIIPIIEEGLTVSYIARSMDGSQPKELSGPNRSWFLYGIDGVKKDEPVVIVEGIFDAEAVIRTGFNSVAIMGSNISDTQVGKLLAKGPNPIIICLDGDKAGAEGAIKAYRKLSKRTHTPMTVVSLEEGVDPDEMPMEQLESYLRAAWRSV